MNKRLIVILATLVALVVTLAACAKPAPAPAPVPSPAPAPAPAPAPVPTPAPEKIELVFSTFMAPSAVQSVISEWWGRELESRTNGRIVFKPSYSGSLLGTTDTYPGVRDGLVQAAPCVPGFHPADFPLNQGIQFSVWDNDTWVLMNAASDVLKTIPELEQEYLSKNIVPLYWEPIIDVPLIVKEVKIEKLDDLKRYTFRSWGAYNKYIDAVGGTSVTIPITEVFDALQRGTVNGILSLTITNITPFGLHERQYCDYLVDIGVGGGPCDPVGMNKKFWDSLPDDIKKIIGELNEEAKAKYVERQMTMEEVELKKILEKGVNVYRLSAEDRERANELAKQGYLDEYYTETEKLGLDGKKVINTWEQTLAKYRPESKFVSIFENLDKFKAEFPNQIP